MSSCTYYEEPSACGAIMEWLKRWVWEKAQGWWPYETLKEMQDQTYTAGRVRKALDSYPHCLWSLQDRRRVMPHSETTCSLSSLLQALFSHQQ